MKHRKYKEKQEIITCKNVVMGKRKSTLKLTRGYMQMQKESEETYDSEEGKVYQILLYISENFKTATVYSTAKHFHYHQKYLPNLLKKYTGKTFTEIIQGYKHDYAKILLAQTDWSYEKIALSIGYSGRRYFCNMFKKKFGMTPDEYRNNSQNC